MNKQDKLVETLVSKLSKPKREAKSNTKTNGPVVYVAILELDYDLIAVGNTAEECKANIIKAFTKWAEDDQDVGSVESWVANIAREDFADYDFDIFRFLNEYYGCAIGKVNGYGVKGNLEYI